MVGEGWVVPTHELVDSIGTLVDSDEQGTLITVLSVDGSAYRRPGAKMLLTEDGTQVGSVTAGCLESQFVDIATSVLESERPRVETFDLTGEGDTWGLGVGCNGVVTFLFEPLTDAYAPVGAAIAADESLALVAALGDDDDVTVRGVFTASNGFETSFRDLPGETLDELRPQLHNALENGTADFYDTGDERVFVDGVVPPPRLLVFGDGTDVQPLVEAGTKNGFRVDVVSFRGASNASERFAGAHAVHTVSAPEVATALALDSDTYAVVMSHNFVDDSLAFQALLDSPVPYIGLLGPRDRFEEMLADLDLVLSEGDRQRIYTPVGIDLGGGTPYQIAHSIVAEVLAVHNGREVGHLSDREGPIHDR